MNIFSLFSKKSGCYKVTFMAIIYFIGLSGLCISVVHCQYWLNLTSSVLLRALVGCMLTGNRNMMQRKQSLPRGGELNCISSKRGETKVLPLLSIHCEPKNKNPSLTVMSTVIHKVELHEQTCSGAPKNRPIFKCIKLFQGNLDSPPLPKMKMILIHFDIWISQISVSLGKKHTIYFNHLGNFS